MRHVLPAPGTPFSSAADLVDVILHDLFQHSLECPELNALLAPQMNLSVPVRIADNGYEFAGQHS
jgi:hypothetical protein